MPKTPAETIADSEILRQALGLPPEEFKLGARTVVFNWRMRLIRKLRGLRQQDLGEKVGCSGNLIGNVETFKVYPSAELADRISRELGVDREDLFPEWLRYYLLESEELVSGKADIKKALENPELKEIPAIFKPAIQDPKADAEDLLELGMLDSAISKVLAGLPLLSRQKKVLILRFGLDGGGTRSLAETARLVGYKHTESARQAEARVLHKLRRPTASRFLRPFRPEEAQSYY